MWQKGIADMMDKIDSTFFTRCLLASCEIINVLNTRHWLLYEDYGVGAGGDESCGGDLIAEAIFAKYLTPFYSIDSEESGFIAARGSAPRGKIVLDPLDGSNNFKSNIPYFGASLALCDSDNIVKEGFIVNFAARKIVYSNERLLKITQVPLTFSFGNLDSIPDLDSIKELESHLQGDEMALRELLNNDKESGDFKGLCKEIMAQSGDVDSTIFPTLFKSGFVRYENKTFSHKLNCGIFEKASYHLDFAKELLKQNLKFRSLGAGALSIGFSFESLFVILPTKVRKYDVLAGFFLAQNEIKTGNLSEYQKYIPNLRAVDSKYILITKDFDVVEKLRNVLT
ncbi:hypothetical protein DCO58_09175 [Helicobacter saguini]|uniref:Inositol monophosphatase n=1 Tax=Helicobacter saguini TaxID=1548018 RepID=A0A347VP51_9HELI|nr:hypothetical protein [Helicobacter saguini]MWV61510.1 hypothetical protein [Helicobacter saguini]MWV67820.1 hypothetical protein [Helicobacter saguini]MWV70712.1 hypothetical protein [Helicobacter saguini]MWV72615.1 hypothetical protein [Helicobacter saguini]TLD94575.1 hypothetical protein LS64_005275 [Helicobacter saguini]